MLHSNKQVIFSLPVYNIIGFRLAQNFIQEMSFHLVGVKPLPEPKLIVCGSFVNELKLYLNQWDSRLL